MTPHIDADAVAGKVDWVGTMAAIEAGHRRPPASVDDTLLRRGDDSLLSRAAMIDGLGALVKTATVFPGNTSHGLPAINGAAALFSDETGELDATIDFGLLTRWKTAADSALAAARLARSDTARVLIVGAGDVAASMVDAYRAVFANARFQIWNRTPERAVQLADAAGATVADDLEHAVAGADVICTATMSADPIVLGEWLVPGQHLDLIGGFRLDMREVDDAAIQRASLFVDNRTTALDVGDVAGPIAAGIIDPSSLLDFRGLDDGSFARTSPDQITVCKNAGGAHLDLMVARHLVEATRS